MRIEGLYRTKLSDWIALRMAQRSAKRFHRAFRTLCRGETFTIRDELFDIIWSTFPKPRASILNYMEETQSEEGYTTYRKLASFDF